MMKTIRRAKAKAQKKLTRNLNDPAIDFVGASQIGLLSGRVVMNGSIAMVAFRAGMLFSSAAVAGIIAFDLFIQFHTLNLFHRLMQFEVWNEILTLTPTISE